MNMFECFDGFRTTGGISMMGWNGGGHMGFGMLFWGIIIILLFVVVISAAVSLTSNKKNSGSDKESALDILEKEFARGNITEEEFNKRRKYLQ